MSFEIVRSKKNMLSKYFWSLIVHGIYYFTPLYIYVDLMQLMNGIVC